MEIKEGYIPFLEYKTYYRIVNPKGKKTPLLMLHGGPGSTHNSFELFDSLANMDDRPIIMYDQLGCGKSKIEEGHKELWNSHTWILELENLRKYLKLDKIHLFGHSFGGMLEIIYLCDYKPKGIKTVTLSSTLSSVKLWEEETHRLIRHLDLNTQAIIQNMEKKKDYESKEALAAMEEYYHRFIFGPFVEGIDPECLTRVKPSAKESYIEAWGKSEFSPSGTLKNYEYTDRLKEIKCPVLIQSGQEDESTPFQNKVMYDSITSIKHWNLYKRSRHMTYYDEHDLYITDLMKFLNQFDD